MILYNIILIYLVSIIICCFIHAAFAHRMPKDFFDFLEMTCLPIMLYKYYKDRDTYKYE